MLIWAVAFASAVLQAPAAIDLPPSRAKISRDVGRQGNLRGGALPDVGDELAWTLPQSLGPGVYQVVVIGRSGARMEGLDFVGAYRIVPPASAFPKGVPPHELTVFVPPDVTPSLVTKTSSYYVFRAPMKAREKLFLRPGDTIRVHASVGWAHIYTLRLEPVPEAQQFDLALACRAIGGLFASGDLRRPPAGKFTVTVVNWRKVPHDFVLHTWLTDEAGARSCEQNQKVAVPPGSARNLVLSLAPGRFGPFWAHVALLDGGKQVAERVLGFGLTPAPSPRDVPDSSPFGIHKSDLSQWPQIGAKWVRLWDTGDTWNRYERQRGMYEFGPLDQKIADAERQGIRVLYVLAYTPTWASARPEESHYTGAGARAEPKDIKDWRDFVSHVARRYRGRIAAYEVWNEPNAGFFSGTVEAYEKLLEAAYEVIKQEDPRAVVLGISGTGNYFGWMEKVFKLGGLKYMDGVSVHTYTTPRSPEEANLVGRYGSTFDLIRRYDGHKPLWNTEVGIWQPERVGSRPLTEEGITARAPEKTRPNWTPGWPYRPVSERRAAEYCARTYLISLAEGVKHLFWYSWITHGMPMYTAAGEPRLLCMSYGALSALFSRAHFLERVDLGSRDLFFLLFDTPQGPLAAAWSAQPSPTTISIPQQGKAALVYDIWGNARQSRAARLKLQLGGRPVYVQGLPLKTLRQVQLAEAEIILQSVEARVSADVGEKNVREHTSAPYHGHRRVMGLPDAGDEITWTLPSTLPPGEYEIRLDGFTGRKPPGTDYVANYRLRIISASGQIELFLKPAPGFKGDNPRKGRWYGLMVASKHVRLGPGDRLAVSSRAPWAFVGHLILRRIKAGEAKTLLRVRPIVGPVKLDGQPNEYPPGQRYSLGRREQVWIGVADRFASTPGHDAWQGPDDCSATFAVGWTPSDLLVWVHVSDDKLFPAAAHQGAWAGDCVEVFLDARPDSRLGKPTIESGVFQILCRAPQKAGTLALEGRVPEGASAFALPDRQGYLVELRIPATALGLRALASGRRLGLDLAVDDADAGEDGRAIRKAQLVFHGTADDFQDPSVYAEVLLQ